MNKINKMQNRNGLVDTENWQLLEGRGVGGMGENVKGWNFKKNLINMDNRMVITRGKGSTGIRRE